jgi:hypothetical protein
MIAETYGVNVHQDVEGCVEDFKRIHEPDSEPDIPKEHMQPEREALDYVRKGRLDPNTGFEIPSTSKTRTAQAKQFGMPSQAWLKNFDLIAWD